MLTIEDFGFDLFESEVKKVEKMSADELRRERRELALELGDPIADRRLNEIEQELKRRKLL